jgi:hypothetical protein
MFIREIVTANASMDYPLCGANTRNIKKRLPDFDRIGANANILQEVAGYRAASSPHVERLGTAVPRRNSQ